MLLHTKTELRLVLAPALSRILELEQNFEPAPLLATAGFSGAFIGPIAGGRLTNSRAHTQALAERS